MQFRLGSAGEPNVWSHCYSVPYMKIPINNQVILRYDGRNVVGWLKTNIVCKPKIRWCHQKETFFALLALCAGNSPGTGGFPSQRPATWSFDLRLNERLSKQLIRQWFETPLRSLWRHCYEQISFIFAVFSHAYGTPGLTTMWWHVCHVWNWGNCPRRVDDKVFFACCRKVSRQRNALTHF